MGRMARTPQGKRRRAPRPSPTARRRLWSGMGLSPKTGGGKDGRRRTPAKRDKPTSVAQTAPENVCCMQSNALRWQGHAPSLSTVSLSALALGKAGSLSARCDGWVLWQCQAAASRARTPQGQAASFPLVPSRCDGRQEEGLRESETYTARLYDVLSGNQGRRALPDGLEADA